MQVTLDASRLNNAREAQIIAAIISGYERTVRIEFGVLKITDALIAMGHAIGATVSHQLDTSDPETYLVRRTREFAQVVFPDVPILIEPDPPAITGI